MATTDKPDKIIYVTVTERHTTGWTGADIRKAREQRGISLRSMATQCGVSSSWLSKLERGLVEPGLATMRTIVSVATCGRTKLTTKGDHGADNNY